MNLFKWIQLDSFMILDHELGINLAKNKNHQTSVQSFFAPPPLSSFSKCLEALLGWQICSCATILSQCKFVMGLGYWSHVVKFGLKWNMTYMYCTLLFFRRSQSSLDWIWGQTSTALKGVHHALPNIMPRFYTIRLYILKTFHFKDTSRRTDDWRYF